MNFNRAIIIMLCFILGFINVNAQDLAFGQWDSHLPYQRGLWVTQSPSKVYYATDWSIMAIDKEDLSLEFISKVEGLSTLGIQRVEYDKYSGFLVIIYLDSNIDIYTPDGVINIPDIKNNRAISGDRRVNNVCFSSEKIAYFSTGFGVVSFDLETFEFGFTTRMGMQVFSAVKVGEVLYAATEDGLYSLDLSRNFNFADFANWDLLGEDSLDCQLFI